MDNMTLGNQITSLNNNLNAAMDSLKTALADLGNISVAVGKLGEISALLGSVGAIAPAKAKRKRRTPAEIAAARAEGKA